MCFYEYGDNKTGIPIELCLSFAASSCQEYHSIFAIFFLKFYQHEYYSRPWHFCQHPGMNSIFLQNECVGKGGMPARCLDKRKMLSVIQ